MDSLLTAGERPVAEYRSGNGPYVIICEHASNRIPKALGTLGLGASDLKRHIAWDPGALDVASGIARRLGGALYHQRYSRLVIDCNRDPELADAITAFSENTPIPGNLNLSLEDRACRIDEVWKPFQEGLERLLDERRAAHRPTALVTVHSFTPIYRGVSRPWHVGVISTDKRSLAESMLSGLRREPALVVGDNEPYSPKDNVDYTIRRHGRDRGLPHVMIEIRNDLLAREAGRGEWVARLAGLLGAVDMAGMAA
jgi:predicted N-formylglutamate amidohydrolase